MTNHRLELNKIASHFLSSESSPGVLYQAGASLKNLLIEVANNVISKENISEDIQTESGVAISAEWALKCIEDIFRTRAFASGLFQAVKDRIAENPGKTIEVLYAGCGPFATLMLPLVTQLSSDQVKFTLLEINPSSVKILIETLAALELNDYVKAIENCDALNYTIDSPDQFDIVVSETMQAGLKNEPQVAISHKLMGQLDQNAVLIPEQVAVHFYLVNDEQRSNFKLGKDMASPYFNDLGPVFVLNRNTIKEHKELFHAEYPDVEFPETLIELPKGAQRKYDAIMLATEVGVYKDHKINVDESAITVLLKALSFQDSMLRINTLAVQYICDQKPGLDIRVVN